MASHLVRHLRQGIGVLRSQLVFARSRSFLSHFKSSSLPRVRSNQFSNVHSIHSRFSLPVKHALSRPFSPPRLPKPPVVPKNVTHVGLGTARAFHSARPIFQNMVDNVPVATRALWEAEWDIKLKKKEARRLRRVSQNKHIPTPRSLLKRNAEPLITIPQPSEIDVYFPIEPVSPVTTYLLVPLAPTPTARMPLSPLSDTGRHPLLPISDLASMHSTHHLHSLRVSTLFSRLDNANVWDDPRVNVDAYAFGPRHDTQEKQCTVLRVTFGGWNATQVRAILGDTAHTWCSIQETFSDIHPTLAPLPNLSHEHTIGPPESVELESAWTSPGSPDSDADVSLPLTTASPSVQHNLVLPTLDFSSSFSDVVHDPRSPPQPILFLRATSELAHDADVTSNFSPSNVSWEYPYLSSSFLSYINGNRGEVDDT